MTHPEATRSGADTGGTISSVLGGLVARTHSGSDAHAGWRWAFVVVPALAVISAVTSALAARDSKAKTSVAFLFLNGMALILLPVTSRGLNGSARSGRRPRAACCSPVTAVRGQACETLLNPRALADE